MAGAALSTWRETTRQVRRYGPAEIQASTHAGMQAYAQVTMQAHTHTNELKDKRGYLDVDWRTQPQRFPPANLRFILINAQRLDSTGTNGQSWKYFL